MFGALVVLALGVSRLMTSSALEAPRNVLLTSFNMDLQLQWEAPEGGAGDLLYSTSFWPRARPGQATPACTDTPLLHCHLSSLAPPLTEFAAYVGSVRARQGNHTSNWTHSNSLTLFTDTVIGPPGLKLLPGPASLEVIITDPEFSVSSLRSTFPEATYNLSYWREGEQQVQKMVQQNRLVLGRLQPQSRYCALVHIQTDLAVSRPSRTACESTGSEEAVPWVAVVATTGVLLVLVALLTVAVRHRGSISYFLCPQEVMPEHWKQHLLAPPSSPVRCNPPPLEVYDPLSIVAEPPTERPRDCLAGS